MFSEWLYCVVRFGTERSPLFVALCGLIKQLRCERKVDVGGAARTLRAQRAKTIDTFVSPLHHGPLRLLEGPCLLLIKNLLKPSFCVCFQAVNSYIKLLFSFYRSHEISNVFVTIKTKKLITKIKASKYRLPSFSFLDFSFFIYELKIVYLMKLTNI